MKRFVLFALGLLFAGCGGNRSAPAPPATGTAVTIADLIDIRHPSSPV